MAAMDDEGAIFRLLDQSSSHELVHEIGSSIPLGLLLLQHLHLGLHGLVLGALGSILLLLELFRLLIGTNLCLSSSPLAGHLEHIGADSLVDCRKFLVNKKTWGQLAYGSNEYWPRTWQP